MSRSIARRCWQNSLWAKRNTCSDNKRHLSAQARKNPKDNDKMLAWQIHSYGSLDELQLSHQTRVPYITKPNEVLVKVEAASINPIDVAMIGGYGATALNLMRQADNIEFPLTLGRDFCGTVVARGLGDYNTLPVGAPVWGVVPVHQQGSHAEYVVVDRRMVGPKPENLTATEAGSVLYAALTAWAGLRWSAGLRPERTAGLRALVLGGAGGVGSSAVQLLRAGGAKVSSTCASDAVPLVESLGADVVIDYTAQDYDQKLVDHGPYDLILDCAGLGSDYAMKQSWDFRNFVTFTTPVLKNFDSLGLFRGVLASTSDLICPNVAALMKGRSVKWAYFIPSAEAIKHVHDLITSQKMKAVVEKVYDFSEAQEAFKKMEGGHSRGKIVLDVAQNVSA